MKFLFQIGFYINLYNHSGMHMADALVSPLVAGVMGTVSAAFLVVAAKKVRKSQTESIVPLMGVMGAFVFAAQMINFSIPGTGSSGHIIGGVLLAVLLGPWAGLIVLSSVLVIQCLLFADGGLMALGCNIFNMAVCMCLIAYPLIFKLLVRYPVSYGKIIRLSVSTCIFGLLLGAVAVTVETKASGITALPMMQFLWFMVPIHLVIGLGEGLATAAVLCFIQKYKPELLLPADQNRPTFSKQLFQFGKTFFFFAILAFFLGITFNWIASSEPDGLEWSVEKVAGTAEITTGTTSKVYGVMQSFQESTALLPKYNNQFAGIIGGVFVLVFTWGIARLVYRKKRMVTEYEE